jgi:hypothetical protein
MSQPRDDRQKDLFRPALDRIINMGHPLVRLGQQIDWASAGWAKSTGHMTATRRCRSGWWRVC